MTIAKWLVQHCLDEALAGDVLEQVAMGKSKGWLWRQIGIALWCTFWKYRVELGYSMLVCFSAILVFPYSMRMVRTVIRWEELPYPLSRLVFELTPLLLDSMFAVVVLMMDTRYGVKGSLRVLMLSWPLMYGLNVGMRSAYAILEAKAGSWAEATLSIVGLFALFSGMFFSALLCRRQVQTARTRS
jgi:hypothetical protein